jgi:hypothetical protein
LPTGARFPGQAGAVEAKRRRASRWIAGIGGTRMTVRTRARLVAAVFVLTAAGCASSGKTTTESSPTTRAVRTTTTTARPKPKPQRDTTPQTPAPTTASVGFDKPAPTPAPAPLPAPRVTVAPPPLPTPTIAPAPIAQPACANVTDASGNPLPCTGGCTPGYSPCIPPGDDVDCAGGSGNGPRYVTGPIQVTGSDPYRLDADHNGVGCQ